MIKGLKPTLAEAGKIKLGGLGEERTSGSGKKFRMPKKYESFVVTSTKRSSKGDLERDEEMMKTLADKDGRVTKIPIVVHSDEIESVFPTAYTCYDGQRLLCSGDGETAARWNKNRTERQKMACPCPYLGAKSGPVCKPHGVLHVSIRVPNRAVAGAIHKWRTTSLISIQRMLGSLQQVLQTVGVLRGVPLVLKVEPVSVAPNGIATTVYCAHIELHARDVMQVQAEALQAAERRRALAGQINGDVDAQYKALIKAPGDEDEHEAQEVEAEFFGPPLPPDTEGGDMSTTYSIMGETDDTLAQFLELVSKCQTLAELKSLHPLVERLPEQDRAKALEAGKKRKAELAQKRAQQ